MTNALNFEKNKVKKIKIEYHSIVCLQRTLFLSSFCVTAKMTDLPIPEILVRQMKVAQNYLVAKEFANYHVIY